MRNLMLLTTSLALVTIWQPASGTNLSDLEDLVKSNGYTYFSRGSGTTRFDSTSYILRVFLDVEDSNFRKSVVVHVKGDVVTPIDDPVSAGDSVSIDVLDIDSDGHTDIVVNEYYEPWFQVRVYLGDGVTGFKKVLDEHSSGKPKITEIAPFIYPLDGVMEVILYEDPVGLGGHVDTRVPYLYVLRDDKYELVDNNCVRSRW